MNKERCYPFSYCRIAMLFLFALLFWLVPRNALAAAPEPQHRPPTNDCYLDNIYYGAVPPGGENSPVLVFVHGYGGLATDWWVNEPGLLVNDSYELAYEAGYRTAFVDLNFNKVTCEAVRKPAEQMLVNGYVLSRQIEEIRAYYHADQVDIIAHSKGGIDAQAALVYWGAWRYVRNVFTLGTPHQGSLLADLLWSPSGSWIVSFLGQRDAGNYSMQTSVMRMFRLATDPRTVDDQSDYYIGAGYGWDRPGGTFQITGRYLLQHPVGGANDGVVTLASTRLVNSEFLFLQPWNHEDLLVGHNIFPFIHAILLQEPAGSVGLVIHAPDTGYVGYPVTFMARAPVTSTLPVSYTWQATEQSELTLSGGISNTVSFVWQQPGSKVVTVTTTSANGIHTKTQVIDIREVIPPVNLEVIGPQVVQVNGSYSFVAQVPLTASVPVTYVWQATDLPALITVGGTTDTEVFLWDKLGTKHITVTATNQGGSTTSVHVVQVDQLPSPSTLTLVGLSEGQTGLGYRFTATVADTAVLPIFYTWEATNQASILKSSGLEDSVEYTWRTPGKKTVTVSAANAGGVVSATHVINISNGVGSSTVHFPLVSRGNGPWLIPVGTEQTPENQLATSATNYVLRGGAVSGSAETVFAIEDQAKALDFTLVTTGADVSATLVSPDGMRLPFASLTRQSIGLLAGAYLVAQQLDNPTPGRWTLELSSPNDAGYLLIVTIDSSLHLQITGLPEDTVLSPQQPVQLHVSNADGTELLSIEQIHATFTSGGADVQSAATMEPSTSSALLSVDAPSKEGFHTLSVDISGQTEGGYDFERTLVKSFVVISDRNDLSLVQFFQSLLDTFD